MSASDRKLVARQSASETSSPSELIRGLGLWSATAIVIGETIGTGVFLVSSEMARMVGSTTLVFAAWIAGAVIVLFGALSYAELGGLFPRAGGAFVYLSRGLGPLWGFLFGWMSSFLERPVAVATLAAGFIRLLGFVFPVVGTPLFSYRVGGSEFVFTAAQPLAAVVVIAVTALNYLSVRLGGAIQMILTSLKIITILIIVVAGFVFGSNPGGAAIATTETFHWGTIVALLTALVPAMWAYNGFNDLGDLGEEVQEPHKNIPRAILMGLAAICGLYLLANAAYFRVLSFSEVAESRHVASDVVQRISGSRGAILLTLSMALSALGALHVVVMTGARIPYAMARESLFFGFARRLHPRFRTPSGALLFIGTVATVLALTGTYEELYSLFVFAVWIFLALNAIALLRLRRKEPELNRPYRAWGYPWTQLIFLVAALALTLNLWTARPVRSSLGLLVILSGIPFFYRWRKAPA
jgi:amino acid transporter